MNRRILLALATALIVSLVSTSVSLAQARIETFAPRAGDFAPSTLVSLPAAESAAGLDRQPAQFAWRLPSDEAISAPLPHVASSREYFVRVSGAELRRGMPVFTTAPAALLRLNPERPRQGFELDAAAISITPAGGLALRGPAALDQIANQRQLEAAGAPFPAGTLAFRLRPELGSGRLTLVVSAGVEDEAGYVLHVFDRGSAIAAELAASRQMYVAGDELIVRLAATDGRRALALAETTAFAVSPSGRSWPLTFRPAEDGAYRASLPLEVAEGGWAGLWEVQIATHGEAGGATFLRNATTAFAVAAPTARLADGPLADGHRAATSAGGLELTLALEVASPSRYAVRGVLYGTSAKGDLVPLAASESAAWLEPGTGALVLRFDAGLLEASGLRAPFELRHVELFDQHRFGLLQRQERLARIEP